jgi:hypothetical protein
MRRNLPSCPQLVVPDSSYRALKRGIEHLGPGVQWMDAVSPIVAAGILAPSRLGGRNDSRC